PYLVSRTVSPVCCARWLRPHSEGRTERFPRWLLLVAVLLAVVGLVAWLAPRLLPRYFPGLVEDLLAGVPEGLSPRVIPLAYRGLLVAGGAGAVLLAAAVLFRIAPAFDRL